MTKTKPPAGRAPAASKASSSSNTSYGRGTGVPHPIDVHVGKRVRARRLFLGMNQETLANRLGITFQQVQKYEGGANRVSASRLSAIAGILGVPISFFFDGIAENPETAGLNRMDDPHTIELLRAYYALPETVRVEFLGMVKAVAKS